MKKILPVFLLLAFISLFFFLPKTNADELDDITKKISDLTNALNNSKKATAPLESQLSSLKGQIADIKTRVSYIENDVAVKRKTIEEGYKNLSAQEKVLAATIRDYYIKSYYDTPLVIFFANTSASNITRMLAYQKAATDEDKRILTNIALSIQDLEIKKRQLEEEEKRLALVKASLDEQSAKLDAVVSGAKAYQAQLSSQIAQLSAQQQQLLAAKQASLNIPQSAYTTQGGCTDDRGVDPGFSPRFALFTYGVPNRVGLNQYGAKGRAEAGQSAETILSSYYNADLNKGYDTGITITVNGTNEYGQSFSNQQWNIEDYVKHIYEMPTGWPSETLKAQAVAARSYALATSNNGASSICPSQRCQVVKQEENSDSWKAAVDATRGWVLTNGGSPIKAWFSSTHGGYVFASSEIGWNATAWTKNAQDASGGIGSFSDLQSNAYDKSSPWFYCDWGARASYNKTAWLKADELADIVNVLRLAKADSSTQTHLSQVDKPNPDGTDTWDAGRVRQELQNRGISPFSTIASGNANADFGSGKISSITFSGDAGSISFSGSEFKQFFNLRAPANINIVGPLYNVEKQ